MSSSNVLAELRRRNVIRMAGLYLVGAWLIVQVAETLLPAFDVPAWVLRATIILLALGFVPALVFAWVFELTPQGLKRDNEVTPLESIAPQTARRLDRTIIVVLALALLYFGIEKFVLAPQGEVARTAQVPATDVPSAAPTPGVPIVSPKSIAVMPFENLSADQDNAYFATGMQDEILTRLAGIRDLKVISRTSTEQYASRPPNLKIVGQQLGVATVLEGSVQKAGGKVRINLQLIDARTDSHLWAQNYDRDLEDVFAVQSDVAEKVAEALKATLLPAESARIASVPTTNVEAHDLFLRGRFLFDELQTGSARDPVATGREASELYRRAIAADPGFALAHAWLSYLLSYLHWYGVDNDSGVVDDARANAATALALQSGLPEAHLAMGYVHYWGHRDYAAALQEFDIARANLPNSAEVLAAIGYVKRRQGDATLGIPEMQHASLVDPRNSLIPREIANSHVLLRRYAAADAAFARSLAVFPDNTEAKSQRAIARMYAGDTASAQRILAAIPADLDPLGSVSLSRFRLQMLLRQPDAALAAISQAPPLLSALFEHSQVPVGLLRGQALTMKGDLRAARAAFLEAEGALQPALVNPVTATDALSHLGLVESGLGRKDAALKAGRAALDRLPISRDLIVGAFTLERLARAEAQVGDTAAAIDHLQQLMGVPAGASLSAATLRIDPSWDPLRSDPRFLKLLSDSERAAKAADTD